MPFPSPACGPLLFFILNNSNSHWNSIRRFFFSLVDSQTADRKCRRKLKNLKKLFPKLPSIPFIEFKWVFFPPSKKLFSFSPSPPLNSLNFRHAVGHSSFCFFSLLQTQPLSLSFMSDFYCILKEKKMSPVWYKFHGSSSLSNFGHEQMSCRT